MCLTLINSFSISSHMLTISVTHASRLSTFASCLDVFPTTVFSSPCSRSIFLAYISLIRSFFCHKIYQTLRSHHNYVHTLATLILPYKHYVYSVHNI